MHGFSEVFYLANPTYQALEYHTNILKEALFIF